MKKVKLLILSIIGLLFLIPFVNFSTAAPGDYVGVNEGDSYSWKVSVNANQFAAMAEDMGETIPLEDLEEIAAMGSVTLSARVDVILTETTMMVNSTLVTYVPVNITFSASIPGVGSGELGTETIPVFSNETDYYIHMMFYGLMSPYMTFLLAAQNLNWTKVVEDINEIYSIHPIYQAFTVTEVVNGFKLAIPEGELNATQKAIEIEMKYTSNGVLSYAGFKYDGVVTMSLSLGGDDEIPGYMLPIIVSAIAAVGIGLIYTIKKKNRI